MLTVLASTFHRLEKVPLTRKIEIQDSGLLTCVPDLVSGSILKWTYQYVNNLFSETSLDHVRELELQEVSSENDTKYLSIWKSSKGLVVLAFKVKTLN